MIRAFACAVLAFAACALPQVAQAGDDPVSVWGEISTRAVQSSRSITNGDDIDSSGVGASADAGFRWTKGRTSVQFDLGAEAFSYSDDNRGTRDGWNAGVEVAHKVSDEITVALAATHHDDIVTLESLSSDQDALRAEVTWERNDDKVTLGAQYRQREYREKSADRGDGMRYTAEYQRHFGSYHWARLYASRESLEADSARRSYDRTILRASYSVPVFAKRLRLRPQIEYRDWTYDDRRVGDDPAAALRHDSYVAPEVGLAYGRSDRGINLWARAAYQFRKSNDPEYSKDAPYLSLTMGYKF